MATPDVQLDTEPVGSQRTVYQDAAVHGAVDGAHSQAHGGLLAADLVAAAAVGMGLTGDSAGKCGAAALIAW